jgi:hypothetical protein
LCCKSYLKSALFTFALDAVRANQGQTAALLIHNYGSGAAPTKSSKTSIKRKMLTIQPRLAFILLANQVLIFRFQLLAVYVLLYWYIIVVLNISHGNMRREIQKLQD